MRGDIQTVLGLIMPDRIQREVLQKHDEARECFKLQTMKPESAQIFKLIIQTYVQHHWSYVGFGKIPDEVAFGEAKRILDNKFADQFRPGFEVAMAEGMKGKMREILNVIADWLKIRASSEYIEHVFYEHVDANSREENLELAKAYDQEFGPIIKRYLPNYDPTLFAFNMRAAFEYHRQAVEQIITGMRRM
jgi:hypothetical protein